MKKKFNTKTLLSRIKKLKKKIETFSLLIKFKQVFKMICWSEFHSGSTFGVVSGLIVEV